MKCIVRIAGIEYKAEYVKKLRIGHLVQLPESVTRGPTAVGPNEVIRMVQS